MPYPTFNGWTIINPPPAPGFKSVVPRMQDTIAENRGAFVPLSQMQQWAGADWWEFDVELPPLEAAQTAAWQAWLASLQGKLNAFQIGDPSRPEPQNPLTGSQPVCAAGNTTASVELATAGWVPSRSRILLPGDYLQIGYRLHMALQPVASDSSGNATINVWPSLREAPALGEAVVLKWPKGLFRLASNARQLSIAVTKLAAVSFKCVEAR